MPALTCPTTVGRAAESDALSELLRGSGGAVFLVGEPGIGKTRLLRHAAATPGLRVLHGRAVPYGRASPYRPLAEAIVSACRRDGPPADPELLPYRAALGRLLPEWYEPASPAEAGVVLGEGVLRLLGLLGAGSGTLLCLEDLHWADPDTVGVLEYLADHARDHGVRCVATARPEPGPGWDLVRGLAARRAATVLELAPLPADDVAEMACGCLGVPTLPDGLPELLERAEGVPFLVEELLGAASDAGGSAAPATAGYSNRAPRTCCPPRSPTGSSPGWRRWTRGTATCRVRRRCSAGGSTSRCWRLCSNARRSSCCPRWTTA